MNSLSPTSNTTQTTSNTTQTTSKYSNHNTVSSTTSEQTVQMVAQRSINIMSNLEESKAQAASTPQNSTSVEYRELIETLNPQEKALSETREEQASKFMEELSSISKNLNEIAPHVDKETFESWLFFTNKIDVLLNKIREDKKVKFYHIIEKMIKLGFEKCINNFLIRLKDNDINLDEFLQILHLMKNNKEDFCKIITTMSQLRNNVFTFYSTNQTLTIIRIREAFATDTAIAKILKRFFIPNKSS